MKTTRIAFKESAIAKPNCFLPHRVEMRNALLAVAPDTVDGIMWITELWRPERHPNDAHTWCNADDIRSRNVIAASQSDRELIMDKWGRDADRYMGDKPENQFEAHGDGPSLHLHAETDPR